MLGIFSTPWEALSGTVKQVLLDGGTNSVGGDADF